MRRIARLIGIVGLVVLVSGMTCDETTGPDIVVEREVRNGAGSLTRLEVRGVRFTPNGEVRINFFMAKIGGGLEPISDGRPPAAIIRAGSDGTFRFDRDIRCPVLEERANFGSIIGADVASGKSDLEELHHPRGSDAECGPF